jgi:hypothetical protein
MSDVIIVPPSGAPALPRGRLIFALDATASRAPTWNIAREIQARMFREAAPLGALDVQLVYYRGFAECRASKWVTSGDALAQLMSRIECVGGATQIKRVLTHIIKETEKAKVGAALFIGDAMEEDSRELADLAGKLGSLSTPLYMFHEGNDAKARAAFRMMALRSGGQFFRFGTGTTQAIEQLASKFGTVAKLAINNTLALEYRA